MNRKNLSLNELCEISQYYRIDNKTSIYVMKKQVNDIMLGKMCVANHNSKYDKVIKIIKNRRVFSKNKKYRLHNTNKFFKKYRRNSMRY